MSQIDALLHRRSDLSTFLVHLTAASAAAETNLVSILTDRQLEARNVYGLLRNYAQDHRFDRPRLYEWQRVVCLTETPLEHVWMMCEEIANRAHPLSQYGLAFAKAWGRAVGINPVWYIDTLRTGHRGADWLTVPLMNLVKQTLRVGGETYAEPFNLEDAAAPEFAGLPLESSPIAQIAPFIETMGPVGPQGEPRRREFWWEREWRCRGNLSFAWSDVVAVFAPATRHAEVRAALAQARQQGDVVPAILDPTWGLERMIGAMADVPEEFAGPLPRY
jgi:hypothetical protein